MFLLDMAHYTMVKNNTFNGVTSIMHFLVRRKALKLSNSLGMKILRSVYLNAFKYINIE